MFLAMAQDIRDCGKAGRSAAQYADTRNLPDENVAELPRKRETSLLLANRLGIGRFKWELEDLAFKHLEPEAYRQMQDLVAEKRADREARLQT